MLYQIGEPIVYCKQKQSSCPGPRAKRITPAAKGENYRYQVDKFWVVSEVHRDGSLTARTRRGKRHSLHPQDPHLRRASWWERLWFNGRFPKLDFSPRPRT